MEFSILFVLFAILLIMVIFSGFYYGFLYYRYKKEQNLILNQRYLDSIFKRSSNPSEASQEQNGDIPISAVTFNCEDFCFSVELKSIVEFFNSKQIGGKYDY